MRRTADASWAKVSIWWTSLEAHQHDGVQGGPSADLHALLNLCRKSQGAELWQEILQCLSDNSTLDTWRLSTFADSAKLVLDPWAFYGCLLPLLPDPCQDTVTCYLQHDERGFMLQIAKIGHFISRFPLTVYAYNVVESCKMKQQLMGERFVSRHFDHDCCYKK